MLDDIVKEEQNKRGYYHKNLFFINQQYIIRNYNFKIYYYSNNKNKMVKNKSNKSYMELLWKSQRKA